MTGFRIAVRLALGNFHLDVDVSGTSRPLVLIGPNGSGKTTLLRIVSGALRPDEGTIDIQGRTLFSSKRGIDMPPEERHIGYVPQGYGLFPHLRVIDNVAFGLSTGARKKARVDRRRAALTVLEELSCAHLADRFPSTLSGGEQQRVALSRALLVQPSLLLLDEPLAALDAGTRRRVRHFVADQLLKSGRPSVVVTHDVRDVAALDASVCVLDRGRVVQTGNLTDLRAAPANEFVAEFVDTEFPAATGTFTR